jgi:hypothetical protein
MKKLTNSTKVLRYIRKNPNAKAREVAKAVGVSINSVYQCTYNAKKKAKSLPMTAIAPVNRVPPKRGRPSKLTEAEFKKLPLPRIAYDDYGNVRPRMMGAPKLDNVNHPPHYKAGGIETIDFIEAKSLNYNLGNVVKYITRADHKGNKLEDLQKAQWYLNREIKNLSK